MKNSIIRSLLCLCHVRSKRFSAYPVRSKRFSAFWAVVTRFALARVMVGGAHPTETLAG